MLARQLQILASLKIQKIYIINLEDCVLGAAKYLGCHDKIFAEYQNINLAIKKDQETRICECGNELLKRERFCVKCKAKKRRDSNKKYNKNKAA